MIHQTLCRLLVLLYIFAYVFVPVTVWTCVRISCAQQLRCLSLPPTQLPAVLTWFNLFATVWREVTCPTLCSNWGRFLDTFQVRRCWIKIDSAVNLGETPSSKFVQCVLWVIRLTKTVESICCAVRHTVTLPRAVWRTICSPHSVRVLIATTTDAAVTDRSPPVLRRQQSVPLISSTTQLSQRVCCSSLAASR